MSRIERFQNSAQLENLIQEAQSQGLRIRLGSQDWTVEILSKKDGNFLDKFRSAESLANIFQNELSALRNKVSELKTRESGGVAGASVNNITERDVRKLSSSNDPKNSQQIDPDIEVHRAIVGVLPTIGRISVGLGVPFLPAKLDQIGRLLNDERVPLRERINYALSALQAETSSLRRASGDENTPGHFQVENFANYIDLQSLQRKKLALATLPQLKSETAAALHHPNDPFALKRFAYKALPTIGQALQAAKASPALQEKLQVTLGQFLKHDTNSIEFEKNRQALLALQPEIVKALKKSSLQDTANAVFETIANATPDRLENLLASDLTQVANSLEHQGERTLAQGFRTLGKKLESTTNISHLDLHQAITELRFLTDQTLEKVDQFSRQPGDTDEWSSLRDKQNIRQFAYAFQSAVEPWKVSPQEFEYVRNRLSEYEQYQSPAPQAATTANPPSATATDSPAPTAPASNPEAIQTQAQATSSVSTSLAQELTKTFEVSDIDTPWYELDAATLFAPNAANTAQAIPDEGITPELEQATQSTSSTIGSSYESGAQTPASTREYSSTKKDISGEVNPTPPLLVKAYAAHIQNRIDQRKFLERIEERDRLLAEGRVRPESAALLAHKDIDETLASSNLSAESASSTPLSVAPAEVIPVAVAKGFVDQQRRDPKLYRTESENTLAQIAESLEASRQRQKSNPLTEREESAYRIELESYALELDDIAFEGNLRKDILRTIAQFNAQSGGNLDEVLSKTAPNVSPERFVQNLQEYIKENTASIRLVEKRITQGYADPKDREHDFARLTQLQRRAGVYATVLAQAKQTWSVDNTSQESARIAEAIAEARSLQALVNGSSGERISLASISEKLQNSLLALADVIIQQITLRENPNTAKADLLSDEELKEVLNLHAELKYVDQLNGAELEAELYALRKARDVQTTTLSQAATEDVGQILRLRTNQVELDLNAHLAIASLKDEPIGGGNVDGIEFTDSGTGGAESASPTQKLWARYAVEGVVGFLASRLALLKLASKTVYV